jgi:hypothetical protein
MVKASVVAVILAQGSATELEHSKRGKHVTTTYSARNFDHELRRPDRRAEILIAREPRVGLRFYI